jgi:hypothetical protein
LTSSCGVFCCICSRAASYASATSASSPTAAAPACCPSASNCYAVQPNKRHHQGSAPQLSSVRTGVAHSAAEPCSSSNQSPRRNYYSVLHRKLPCAQHEPLSPIWILSRSSARRAKPCLIPPATASCDRSRSSPRPGTSSFGQPPALYLTNKRTKHRRCRNCRYPSAHSNYISIRRHCGFLQVAVSEVPTSLPISAMPRRVGTSDTAQRLHIT